LQHTKVPTSSKASTSKLPRLRVLSLFDGIGTGNSKNKKQTRKTFIALYRTRNFLLIIVFFFIGYLSLKELGFNVEVFYASEIDKDALLLTKYHFSNIIQLGSVTEITNEVLDKIGPINLLFGGSPCNDLSSVNYRKKGIYGN